MSVLECERLVRTFDRGRFLAVDDLSLSLGAGEVHGLLGPNGAGKTTTVRMCATLLTPDRGQVVVGIDAVRRPERARRELGLVLGGDLGFYPRASARDNLLFFADVAGVSSRARRDEVDRVLARVALSDRADEKVGSYSRGMKQRLHVARALLGRPPLLPLDEPTTGSDPDSALQVRDLVRELAEDGAAILLTSHSLPEVEELATVITVIGAGRVEVRGQVQDVARAAGIGATFTFSLPASDSALIASLSDDLRESRAPAGSVVVETRPRGAVWSVTVYWPAEQGPEGDVVCCADGAARRSLVSVGAAVPPDLITRPASLEEAWAWRTGWYGSDGTVADGRVPGASALLGALFRPVDGPDHCGLEPGPVPGRPGVGDSSLDRMDEGRQYQDVDNLYSIRRNSGIREVQRRSGPLGVDASWLSSRDIRRRLGGSHVRDSRLSGVLDYCVCRRGGRRQGARADEPGWCAPGARCGVHCGLVVGRLRRGVSRNLLHRGLPVGITGRRSRRLSEPFSPGRVSGAGFFG